MSALPCTGWPASTPERGEWQLAARYYHANLNSLDAEGLGALGGQDVADALLYLAEYEKDMRNLPVAEAYCQRLTDSNHLQAAAKPKAMLLELHTHCA